MRPSSPSSWAEPSSSLVSAVSSVAPTSSCSPSSWETDAETGGRQHGRSQTVSWRNVGLPHLIVSLAVLAVCRLLPLVRRLLVPLGRFVVGTLGLGGRRGLLVILVVVLVAARVHDDGLGLTSCLLGARRFGFVLVLLGFGRRVVARQLLLRLLLLLDG